MRHAHSVISARDEIFATNFSAEQRDTVQSLTRLETQMGILLQERRVGAPQPPQPIYPPW
ncbi:hypothetical protein E8L99_18475 [Phreatobacter aquaticus]|uniref:Uncharacterized protein n=1 Tax=Phreatobacter aquaticus TaxID=2570229 RepID=A0A4D7QUI2_9HYPH|nr:hypothetical protein [Phreatobacter aquaticus]QCK87602.1 hypothetical protein E8L99_18475 [Phreatobacter aquaticus]